MNFALSEDAFDSNASKDMANQAFWDTLADVLAAGLEMVREKAVEMGIDLDAPDLEEALEQDEHIRAMAREQSYSQAAMKYIERVNKWFEQNEDRLDEIGDELTSLAQAEIPGTNPEDDAIDIGDCFEVIRWYQHQIYVKLCRAATGTIRAETDTFECLQEDADGSAKVAIIGIERSTAAWASLLAHLPDQEPAILDILVALKRLLSQVEAAFPGARTFVRPGFDATDECS